MKVKRHKDKFVIELPNIENLKFIDVSQDSSGLKSGSGIYFIYDSNKTLVYIGQSKNVRNRITAHRNGYGKGFFKQKPQVNPNEVKFVRVLYGLNIDFIEHFYIYYFHPDRNSSQYDKETPELPPSKKELDEMRELMEIEND